MNTAKKEEKAPIGAYIKKANDVFTNLTRKTSNHGTFNRIDWQFFNFLIERRWASEQEILEFLSFFDNEEAIRRVIVRFQNDGLITSNQKQFAITSKGEEVFEEVLTIQEEIKAKAVEGITDDDYITTIETLEKIIKNLKDYIPNE